MSSKEVLKGMLSSFKTVDFDTDTGLRYRVRTCLEHIDKALGQHTLVIFVDDLDRCPAEQVLKVLEVVNFLSASPVKSFVIFGISLEIVLPIISPEFSDLVEEQHGAELSTYPSQRELELREKRLGLARQYLRKIINVEISVPKVPPQELKRLIEASKVVRSPPETARDRANTRARILDRVVFPGLLTIGLALLLIFGPLQTPISKGWTTLVDSPKEDNLKRPAPNAEDTKSAPETETDLTGQSGSEEDKGEEIGKEDAKTTPQTETIVPSTTLRDILELVGVLAVLALVIGMLLLRSARKAEVSDSRTFVQAVEVWAPILTLRDPTPRHFIRHVNQLRLISTRLRIEPDFGEGTKSSANPDAESSQMICMTVLQALRGIGVPPSKVLEVPQGGPGPEHVLPVVSALLANSESLADPAAEEAMRKTLTDVIEQHLKNYESIWPGNHDIEIFERLTQGVKLS